MTDQDELIPPPPIVRDRLARNIQEGRLLRALLRLSLRAADARHEHRLREARHKAAGEGVA